MDPVRSTSICSENFLSSSIFFSTSLIGCSNSRKSSTPDLLNLGDFLQLRIGSRGLLRLAARAGGSRGVADGFQLGQDGLDGGSDVELAGAGEGLEVLDPFFNLLEGLVELPRGVQPRVPDF